MKATLWVGSLLVFAVTGTLLFGNIRAVGSELQGGAELLDTNAVSSVATNMAAYNVLNSTLPDGVVPDSPYAQLIRMVQAGVDQGVMLAYISQSPRLFELDADSIIYLTDIGTPPEVITAVLTHDQKLIEEGIGSGAETQGTVAEEPVDEGPSDVTTNELYTTLSPYGSWVYISGYGRCWRPTVVIHDSGWRPYCDNGRWIYTDHGWYWRSNYSWGWAAFHYGRWFYDSHYGWCWWPDTVWAPSWVCWRYNNSYCGWAPLPPHTVYRSGVGIVYRGSAVSVGFDFDLNLTSFTFVSARNFCDPDPRRHLVDRRDVERIYRTTTGVHRMEFDRTRRGIVNDGIPVQEISVATQRDIKPLSLHNARKRMDRRVLSDQVSSRRDVPQNRPASRLDLHTGTTTQSGPADRTPKRTVVQPLKPHPYPATPSVQERKQPARHNNKDRVTQTPFKTKPTEPQPVKKVPQKPTLPKPAPAKAWKSTKTPSSFSHNPVHGQKQKANPPEQHMKKAKKNEQEQ